DDERQRGRKRSQPEYLVGKQRQHGAILADHAADERVHCNEQRELRDVLAQAETYRADFGVAHSTSSGRPVRAAQSSGPPTSTRSSDAPRASRMLAALIARSPCPHITVIALSGNSATLIAPSSMFVASGRCPDANSSCCRTSTITPSSSSTSTRWMDAVGNSAAIHMRMPPARRPARFS